MRGFDPAEYSGRVANYQRNEIVPGLFVLAAGAVFTLFAFRIGRWQVLNFLKGDRVACRAVFDEVKTLAVGAKVSVAGRRVGEVSGLRWTETPYTQQDLDQLARQLGSVPDGLRAGARHLVVEVAFDLTDRELRLQPDAAQVALLQDGLLGNYFLDLYPGHWEPAREPATILRAELPEPVTLRARRVAGIDAMAATLGDAIRSIQSLVETLHEGVLSESNRDNLGGMLQALRQASDAFATLLRSDNEAGVEANALRPLRRVFDGAADTLTQLRDRLLAQTLPQAERTLEQAQQSARAIETAVGTARTDLERVMAQVETALLEVRPDLAESARRLRESLWQAELALRKIRLDPSVLLFGGGEQDLEARSQPGNPAPNGRARIYRQRDERADGK